MDFLGRIVGFSTGGTIIVRASSSPGLGVVLCDIRGRDLGRVIRITGPVGSPFLVLKPFDKTPEGTVRLIGKDVVLSRSQGRGMSKGHYKKDPGDRSAKGPDRPWSGDGRFGDGRRTATDRMDKRGRPYRRRSLG